jgi:hypothetical protein
MWIDFRNRDNIRYQIKVYVEGVNAISGEPFNENVATRLRRKEKMKAARHTDRKALPYLHQHQPGSVHHCLRW